MDTVKNKSHLTTKSLKKLREALPDGAFTVISEHFNVNKSTVSRVLSGKTENLDIIEYAILLVKQKRDRIDAIETEINTLAK